MISDKSKGKNEGRDNEKYKLKGIRKSTSPNLKIAISIRRVNQELPQV